MLKILPSSRIADGLLVLGFGLLAIGIAMNFQTKKTEKTEIKVKSIVKGEMIIEPTGIKIKEKPAYAEATADKVNINTAEVVELDKLTGVGPVIAQRIIDYRKENNGFMNIEEIKLVKGIGEKMYERIKDNIEI